MTVLAVTPKYGSLVGTGSLAGVREYTKVFVVETDDVADGIITVGNAFGIPHKGDYYFWHGETDAGALCSSVTPVRDTENELWWLVTCEFSSDRRGRDGPTGQDPRYDNTNPLLNPPVVTWDHWEEEEEIKADRFGEAILTPAGKVYAPPPTRRRKYRRVVVSRNELVYPVVLDRAMTGKVNSDGFFGWAPRQAKLDNITATTQFSQNMIYWRVTYEILFKKPDHDLDILRMGTVVLVDELSPSGPPTGRKLETLPTDQKTGIQHTNPVAMFPDGEQMLVADVEAARLVHPRSPFSLFKKYEVDEQTPFSVLNF